MAMQVDSAADRNQTALGGLGAGKSSERACSLTYCRRVAHLIAQDVLDGKQASLLL